MNHTPGRWTFELDVVDDGDINVFADGGPGGGIPGLPIASIDVRSGPDMNDGPPREAAIANARLIAAAPELLEALRAFVHEAQSYHVSCGHGLEGCAAECDSICECLSSGLAAIAKAEGK